MMKLEYLGVLLIYLSLSSCSVNIEPIHGDELELNVNGENNYIPVETFQDESTQAKNRHLVVHLENPRDQKWFVNRSTQPKLTTAISKLMKNINGDMNSIMQPKRINEKKNEQISRYEKKFKILCEKVKTLKLNEKICNSHGDFMGHNIIKWLRILLRHLYAYSLEKIKMEYSKQAEAKNFKTLSDPISKLQLKKRCCRYHFKYYFKYFPVLQPFVVPLLESIEKELTLSLIMDIGFITSIFALVFILLSVVLSRKLRERKGNIILAHFCFSIFVQIILHVLICLFNLNITLSKWTSIIFQYFTLVEFAWTSVIALIQYRRYVIVFDSTLNSSVLKITAFIYIICAIPIAARILWDHNHSKLMMTFLTFSLPQFLTLIINLIILILISRNIMCMSSWSPQQKRNISVEAKLIFILFLTLDLGWIIAMLAYLSSNIIFAYIFIFSQSLQGFALFFTFILMNKPNRKILKQIWIIHTSRKSVELNERPVAIQGDPGSTEQFI
ncbi:adhesion G-protein coupled receptor D1-like [Harmonia axyridis]|uniref:adhesion G-protein coupled receptor D1-like n=1 Tax=Harmonia axyridis TaxID=115357 RepID=UPI001E279B4C|nr:adhesion G-protein coupled receptor D1-like [Harmonia axyridis]